MTGLKVCSTGQLVFVFSVLEHFSVSFAVHCPPLMTDVKHSDICLTTAVLQMLRKVKFAVIFPL